MSAAFSSFLTRNTTVSNVGAIETDAILYSDEHNNLSAVFIFPNTSNGQFTIELKSINEFKSINILDALGQEIPF